MKILYQPDNSDELLPVDKAFLGVKSNAIIKVVIMPDTSNKRCHCGGGECWACWLDMIDEHLIIDPTWRSCTCGNKWCAECNYYKAISKFISTEEYNYE